MNKYLSYQDVWFFIFYVCSSLIRERTSYVVVLIVYIHYSM
jgi:hypothetical protein